MSIPISLIEMPEIPMKHILKHCDFPSIPILRKVCHDLRNFIDVTKPASHLTRINFEVFPEYILFSLEPQSQNEIHIFYAKCSEGCSVRKFHHRYEEVNKTILDNEDFVTVFCKDVDFVLRHQKTVLEEFNTTFRSSSNSTDLGRILEDVKKSFTSMDHLLQVKSLRMTVSNQNEILSILPYIDPKPLELIIIDQISTQRDMLNFNEIGLLEQWKQAKELLVLGLQITTNHLYQNIKHFSRITFRYREFQTEEILLLKGIFLSSPTLTAIEVDNPCRDVVGERLIEAFGESLVGFDQDRFWFFAIPDTNQFLKMKLDYRDDHIHRIHFYRIDKSDVPKNAIIQN